MYNIATHTWSSHGIVVDLHTGKLFYDKLFLILNYASAIKPDKLDHLTEDIYNSGTNKNVAALTDTP